jgi:hypothetical protein
MTEESILVLDYCDYVYLYNNTVYDDYPDGTENCRIYIQDGATHVTVKNNIAVQDNLSLAAFKVELASSIAECDYNCWYNTGGGSQRYVTVVSINYHYDDFDTNENYKGDTGWDTHGKWESPLFVNAGGTTAVDYMLTPTSPCINAGTDVGLTEDYAGNPIVGLPDIGAYEYQFFSNRFPPRLPLRLPCRVPLRKGG